MNRPTPSMIWIWPRRDWRFWAALAAAALVTCVMISFISTLGRADRLQNQVDQFTTAQATSDEVAECRSRAAVWSDKISHEETAIQSFALADLTHPENLPLYAAALLAATHNAKAALEARDAAVEICATQPSYQIDPKLVLIPVPAYPHDQGG